MSSELDRKILKELQNNFPVSGRPFAVAAEKFGLSEEALIRRLRIMKKKKLIRYLGAIFEAKKLGIKSTLVAMSVPKNMLGRVIRLVNSYPQVSHNYLRRGEYNIWFTLSAGSKAGLCALFKEIKKKSKAVKVLNLETIRVFKIDARFDPGKR